VAPRLLPGARHDRARQRASGAARGAESPGSRATGARLGAGRGAPRARLGARDGAGDPRRPLPPAGGGGAMKPFVRRLRRMLLLVPAAWKAGPKGLPTRSRRPSSAGSR
jgi:hypothetical protein